MQFSMLISISQSGRLFETFRISLVSTSFFQVRYKKSKRKKGTKFVRTAEQEVARGKSFITLNQRLGNPETPYRMSTNIKSFMARLTAFDKTQTRRKKDHQRYAVHRYLSLSDMTHDDIPFTSKREGFMTDLTSLQHTADLPVNINSYDRFPFPHLFSYKVYWGPPTVQELPNKNEGSMTGCTVSVRLSDLGLSERQEVLFKKIVGDRIYDHDTGVVTMRADRFNELNQNAALLGDMLDCLLKEVKSEK